MKLLSIVLLPLAGVLLPLLVDRLGRLFCALAAGIPTLIAFIALLTFAPEIVSGEVFTTSWTWIGELGLNFSFRLDGLGFLFALLILGIGLLVITYAYSYLHSDDPIGRFYSMLMLFMGAMLGVVLSENMLLMAFFWEMTSLSSFLLIGYWHYKEEARKGARMALAITGAGGLCLFGGLILLGQIAGSYELSVVLESADVIQNHEWYLPALFLILAGAFTKSAQFPFHFWLPNAMTAPTPVSAYLHSATMVKAGVFLLARLHPALAGTDAWFFTVTFVGLATLTVGAYVALYKHDLKGLLAYSTISHLGLITVLFGFGSKFAAFVGVFHIMNHAAFKASLFMTAGIVDHETGTRDIRKLGGLRKLMPYTMVVGLIGAAAMAGVPLFNGFLSKEMFFDAAWQIPQMEAYPWLIPAIATIGGLFSVAYSIRFVHDVFFGEEVETPKHAHDPPMIMLLPPIVLVTICVIVGVVPHLVEGFVETVASAVLFGGPSVDMPHFHIKLWHGFGAPLVMSIIAFAGAALVYTQRHKLYAFAEENWQGLTGRGVFEELLEGLTVASRGITDGLENGSLQRYTALLIGFAVLAAFIPFWQHGWEPGTMPTTAIDGVSAVVMVIMITGALGTILFHRKRLLALVMISTVGLVTALIFVRMSAPDLAMTQLSVEVVTILLLLLALHLLPEETPDDSSAPRKWRDGLLAGVGGVGAGLMVWAIITRPLESISDWHLANSYEGGGGTNAVNVILVDFRGFDTMLEISVLAIAALGVYMLLDGVDIEEPKTSNKEPASDAFPVILTALTRPLMSMIILMSIFIFFRGHNLPGGGFIGGLVATVALVIQDFASGSRWTEARINVDFQKMALVGVVIAVLTGAAALLLGYPFLTGWHDYVHPPVLEKIHLASAIVFDLGVYLAVIGSMMVILSRLGRLGGTTDPVDYEHRKESSPWKP